MARKSDAQKFYEAAVARLEEFIRVCNATIDKISSEREAYKEAIQSMDRLLDAAPKQRKRNAERKGRRSSKEDGSAEAPGVPDQGT